MPGYHARLLDSLLDSHLEQLPALLLVGPRGCGKTTTALRRAASPIRLDRAQEAAAFIADPDAALAGLPEPVLLDEWQEVPGVLGAVRRAVDADPRPGRFLVTGSVRAALEGEIWPGTGRLVRIGMYPMTVAERAGELPQGPSFLDRLTAGEPPAAPGDPPDLRGYIERALESGYPEPALNLSGAPRAAWLRSYIDDLVSRDVAQLDPSPTRSRDPRRLRRYLEAVALNSAGTVAHKTLYDSAGINRETAEAYEGLLAGLLIVESVPAWASNRLKRLIRQPKRYLVDPALLAAALDLEERAFLSNGDLLGRLLDTQVAAQLRPLLTTGARTARLHHLRTEQGRHEIDLLIEFAGGEMIAIEVKAAGAPTSSDARHLVWLGEQLGDRLLAKVLLHTGPRVFELDAGVIAAPIASVWA